LTAKPPEFGAGAHMPMYVKKSLDCASPWQSNFQFPNGERKRLVFYSRDARKKQEKKIQGKEKGKE